ncbi:hypothetical protein M413DRAFT_240145 [Hebeloma cylindrosporum]|uniref:Uncharacterized protein n=1 Tax=Hebeloma cylindrosporum TaxID=76867 RepID=A0A0C2YCE9_HEBCY|nr:hypothetical protein M413DRAFT_240145 [Hebeloma cylindrosporum h7]
MLCMDQADPSGVLVQDSIWAVASQAIADTLLDDHVQQDSDALTFTCLRGGSFKDFCSMIDDIFELHEVHKGRGSSKLEEKVAGDAGSLAEEVLDVAY